MFLFNRLPKIDPTELTLTEMSKMFSHLNENLIKLSSVVKKTEYVKTLHKNMIRYGVTDNIRTNLALLDVPVSDNTSFEQLSDKLTQIDNKNETTIRDIGNAIKQHITGVDYCNTYRIWLGHVNGMVRRLNKQQSKIKACTAEITDKPYYGYGYESFILHVNAVSHIVGVLNTVDLNLHKSAVSKAIYPVALEVLDFKKGDNIYTSDETIHLEKVTHNNLSMDDVVKIYDIVIKHLSSNPLKLGKVITQLTSYIDHLASVDEPSILIDRICEVRCITERVLFEQAMLLDQAQKMVK